MHLSKIKFKDPLIVWAVSGFIGVTVRDIYSYFAKLVGLAKFQIWNIGSSLMVVKPEVNTFWGNIVGLLVDAIIGSLMGIAIGFFLKWRGKSYYLLKGWGAGVMAWLFMYGLLFHNLPFTKENAPQDALSNFSAFIGHSIFGLITVIVYVKWLSKYEAKETRVEKKSEQIIYVVNPEIQRTSVFQRIKARFSNKLK